MPYEIELPRDTQNEIEEFIQRRYLGQAAELAAVDALATEMDNLAANPGLGAVPVGTPFDRRRIHRFKLVVGDTLRLVELIYRVSHENRTIVFHGFREVPTSPL